MKTYELTFALGEKFTEEEAEKIKEQVKKNLPDIEIIKEEFLGRKKLAYKINKNDFGYYYVITFKTDPENIVKIDEKLKLNQDMMRYLITAMKSRPAKIVKPKTDKVPTPQGVGIPTASVGKTPKPEKLEKIEKTPETKAIKEKAKPKKEEKKVEKIEKPKKAKPKITDEIETEEKKMKELDEKLDEILKV
jgi:small subunit ribosomal protein S6